MFTHSISGGTGSGVVGSLLSHTNMDIGPKIKLVSCCVWPSQNMSNEIVEPYNAILANHDME